MMKYRVSVVMVFYLNTFMKNLGNWLALIMLAALAVFHITVQHWPF